MSQWFLKAAGLALFAASVRATDEVGMYQQCGGINFSGPTKCVSGAYCIKYNDWYHQCIPSPSSTSTTVKATTTFTPSTLSISTRTSSTFSAATSTSATGGVKYLITFGDSYSQTGFDITGTKPAPGNPLGNPPLPGWTASGGLNWVGLLTSQFNTSTLLTYNFASGGATTNGTIIPPYATTVLPLIEQVALFSGSIASKPSYAPWTAENSLFGMWIGVNDVGNAWFKSDFDSVLAQIMDTYFGRLQVMYDAGARNFVLLTVPPTERSPMIIAQGAETVQGLAVAITKYNAAIATRLEVFKSKNSGVTAKLVDTQPLFNTALDNPIAYNSPDATCTNGDGKSCLWFNEYHPGFEINLLVAKAVADAYKGSFF